MTIEQVMAVERAKMGHRACLKDVHLFDSGYHAEGRTVWNAQCDHCGLTFTLELTVKPVQAKP